MTPAHLPKVELHCHLDGILDRAMLRDIRKEVPSFPIDPADFERAYPVNSFESFVRWWDFVRSIERTLDACYPILERHIGRLKAQNVVYTEIMITGGQLPADPQEAIDKLAPFREWVNQSESESFQIEFLLAVGRKKTAEQFTSLASRTIALYRADLICGFAIAGPEEGHLIQPFERTMNRIHDEGIPIEIHAGEWCGPESVRDAIRYGKPHRIGHGVSLFQDPALVDIVAEKGIHLEFCPTSNLKTESIKRIEDHPLRKALELGLSFSINTDDPGPFENTMASEAELLAQAFGLDVTVFERILVNSLQARFGKRKL